MQAVEIKKSGIIFEVIKIKIDLQVLELNKYLIPKKLLRVNIEDICKGQQGVFVEKRLIERIKVKGKKIKINF